MGLVNRCKESAQVQVQCCAPCSMLCPSRQWNSCWKSLSSAASFQVLHLTHLPGPPAGDAKKTHQRTSVGDKCSGTHSHKSVFQPDGFLQGTTNWHGMSWYSWCARASYNAQNAGDSPHNSIIAPNFYMSRRSYRVGKHGKTLLKEQSLLKAPLCW